MTSASDRQRGHSEVRILAAGLLLMSISGARLQAQLDPQPILSAQFSFSNPGARSLGLGGAFVALADDATAAWANPAGLVQIARPEVSVEGRYWSYSTSFVVGGSVGGAPTGIGLDTVDGLRTDTSGFSTSDLAFLSFVYPKGRWSVAVYRHLFSNFETDEGTEGLFSGDPTCCRFRYVDQRNMANLNAVSYGVSAGYRASDVFSIGFGLIYYDNSALEIQTDLYFWDNLEDPLGSATTYLPEHFILGQTLYGSGSSIGFSGGFLWRIGQRWSVGGRYRQGPKVDLSGVARVGGVIDLGLPPGTVVELDANAEAELPENFGLGGAYRSVDGRLTLSFEWARVTYSDPVESLRLIDQQAKDADELHLGGEWVFLESRPLIALRAGLWHDPAHQTHGNLRSDEVTAALLQAGEDDLHIAAGLGLAFDKWQLDAAIDLADSRDTASISVVYSF